MSIICMHWLQMNIDYVGIGPWQSICNRNVWLTKRIRRLGTNHVDIMSLTVPIDTQARSRTASMCSPRKLQSSAGAENMSIVRRWGSVHVLVPMLHHCHTPASTLMQISLILRRIHISENITCLWGFCYDITSITPNIDNPILLMPTTGSVWGKFQQSLVSKTILQHSNLFVDSAEFSTIIINGLKQADLKIVR